MKIVVGYDGSDHARRALERAAELASPGDEVLVLGAVEPKLEPETHGAHQDPSESAASALVERGLMEEAGRSQFGAVLYRTTPLFLKLFGLRSLEELPELEQWDPSPEDQAALRDRLLRAGDERSASSN